MTDANLVKLRRLFLDRYDNLKAKLTQRLGSADLAGDALQDTWIKLARTETVGIVQSPSSYLFRVILNVARDNRRAEKRHLTAMEIESLLDLADDTPHPAQVAEARSELHAFEAVLAELPPLRRAILLAARVDNLPRQEIADRLGISLRLVSKELRLAHEYCVARRKEMKD
ncbi:RNA polymerase subunit sigma-70 [Rhodoblastus sphagnicola]|uniref:RNA polymerase subunit sigma-70 n=1 Tax=Rhodoblastus sphagnicola TaxID=333368 RepID=A0A2S6MWK6_9HYPH|nr:RNA polymerase sigma factor [Rhodoblastus sphagnicola]MBB4199986.1 RNA polymerase sigma-70 factor (ECF subfamily) [Rhodoblastus sphagnicola]PPQ26745.1 RNA polymerase subunit sigma-70 [Rhodoblastus sphagnicola]